MTSSSQFTALVVEDGPLQPTLRTSLRGSKFSLEDASTPEEALKLLHQKQFDLVILNVEHLRGLALIELWKAGAKQGGFFPTGLNGTIISSTEAAAAAKIAA